MCSRKNAAALGGRILSLSIKKSGVWVCDFHNKQRGGCVDFSTRVVHVWSVRACRHGIVIVMSPFSRSTTTLVIVFVLLIAVAFVIEFFSQVPPEQQQMARVLPPQPALTPERTVEAIGTAQFAALVSYTDAGFEPASVSVHAGDTVRFINNARTPLALAMNTESDVHALPPGEYVSITFDDAGVYSVNNQSTAAACSINVQ